MGTDQISQSVKPEEFKKNKKKTRLCGVEIRI
jgi:hypothetical protein